VEVLVRREAEPIAVLLGRKVVTCRGQSLERRLDVADVKFRLGDSKPYLRDCRLGLTAVRLEEDGGGDFLVETRNGEEVPGLVQRDVTNARTAAIVWASCLCHLVVQRLMLQGSCLISWS
jgi:hypothetical protein